MANSGRNFLVHVMSRRSVSAIIILLLLVASFKLKGEASLLSAIVAGITLMYLLTQDDRIYLESIFIILIYAAIYEAFKNQINSLEFSMAVQLSIIFALYMIYMLAKLVYSMHGRRLAEVWHKG